MNDECALIKIDNGITLIPKSIIAQFLNTEAVHDKIIRLDSSLIVSLNNHIHVNKQKNELLEHVFKGLTENHNSLTQINVNLEILMKQMIDNWNGITNLQKSIDKLEYIATSGPSCDNMHIKVAETIDDFLAIEEQIKNKHYYDYLVSVLSQVGGRNVETTTRNIWSKLCSHKLATLICWTGANGKFCLKSLLLNKLVKDCVSRNYPEGTETQIQRATKLWFSHAPDRVKYKQNMLPATN